MTAQTEMSPVYSCRCRPIWPAVGRSTFPASGSQIQRRELWPGYDQAPAETMRLSPDELAAALGSMRSDAVEAGNIARLDALGS